MKHIHLLLWIFLVVSVHFVSGQFGSRRYVFRRDLVNGFKASEYSIYDAQEQRLFYRLESRVSFMPQIELIAYPYKNVIGRVNARMNAFVANYEIALLDPMSYQWIPGTITQNFQFLGKSFNILWAGERISLQLPPLSLTHQFQDINGNLLAEYRIRFGSMLWARKYDLTIYRNTYPDELYMLALVAFEQSARSYK